MDITKTLSNEFGLTVNHTENIVKLLDEGNTVPFIARYRKEMTGSVNDQVLRELSDRLEYLRSLEERKAEITASIQEQGKFTEEIKNALEKATKMAEVEDIYLPFKPKKTTKASIATEKGLLPLAELIMSGKDVDLSAECVKFISPEKDVNSIDDALSGAKDIIAEKISDDAELRKALREYFAKNAVIRSKAKSQDFDKTYEMYQDYNEKAQTMPSHRILAVNRGEKEKQLTVKVEVNEDDVYSIIEDKYLNAKAPGARIVQLGIESSYKNLLFPSLERELRRDLTDRANEEAIKTFELNLRQLLLQPPLHGKVILALDPAYRTGCKVAVINEQGDVKAKGVVYPTPPQNKIEEAETKLLAAIKAYHVNVIAIGNGTASKETEIFAANMIKKHNLNVEYAMVNEAGASVYSASKLGAEEFPDFDVSIRSAVSIARRLQDPLAELIKIDVKSIGVGEYQHDMPEKRLTSVLEGVVEDCVNSVGVDLNTASASLLSYVAGLNKTIANNIIDYRQDKPFSSRKELLKVAKLGPKAYEQCAGFLRIREGKDVLDNTGVHPESYPAVAKLLSLFGYTDQDVKKGNIADLPSKIQQMGMDKVASECGIGVYTLSDIVTELLKPGRDIRDALPKPILRKDLLSIDDLEEGMELVGTVRNVVAFGVFVDIGVHQDGLVHISQLSDRFLKSASEVVKVGDIVNVRVIGVDKVKNKISLSMRSNEPRVRKNDKPAKKVEKEETYDQAMAKLMSKFGRK